MGKVVGRIGRTDRPAECLAKWIERATGYKNSDTWAQWCEGTRIALEQYHQDREQMLELVTKAKFSLLDHDILSVAAYLNELGELLR